MIGGGRDESLPSGESSRRCRPTLALPVPGFPRPIGRDPWEAAVQALSGFGSGAPVHRREVSRNVSEPGIPGSPVRRIAFATTRQFLGDSSFRFPSRHYRTILAHSTRRASSLRLRAIWRSAVCSPGGQVSTGAMRAIDLPPWFQIISQETS